MPDGVIRKISVPEIFSGISTGSIRPPWAACFFEDSDAIAVETRVRLLPDGTGMIVSVPFTFWYRSEDGGLEARDLLSLPCSGLLLAARMLKGVDYGLAGMRTALDKKSDWKGHTIRGFWQRHSTQFVDTALVHALREPNGPFEGMMSDIFMDPALTAHERIRQISMVSKDLRDLHAILEADPLVKPGAMGPVSASLLKFEPSWAPRMASG